MKQPFIIGITGGSGSGKTTFINSIRETFKKKDVCIISQDDYYKPREDQKKDDQGIINFDLPHSIDKKAFLKDILKLKEGKKVTLIEYTFNNKNKDPKKITLHSAPIIIIEGLFIFHFKKINRELDMKIFLDAKENLKVIRRIKRDRIERNYPLDDVLYRYENHVLPAFEKYVKPHASKCDVIINNNESFDQGLEMMVGYLKNKLKKIKS